MNSAMEYIPTRRERLGWHLFPRVDQPEKPCPFNGRDMAITDVTAELSFGDRIRLLVSGRLSVRVRTETENVLGKVHSNSEIHVQPPRWLSR